MANEASVGLFPDSTGKKARTLELQVAQPDGSVATVEMQVVSIADGAGNVIGFPDQVLLRQIADDMRLLRTAFERWTNTQGTL